MPEIVINEFDNTGTPAGYKAANTVFIPGPLGKGATADSSEPKLCFDKAEFEKYFGTSIEENSSNYLSWVMAHQLVKLGLPVLYWGGVNVTNQVEAEKIYGKLTSSSESGNDSELGAICDKALYNIRFITCGAISAGTTFTLPSYESESGPVVIPFDYKALGRMMINAAYQRGDAVALLSSGTGEGLSDPKNLKRYISQLCDYTWEKSLDPYDPSKVESGQEALKFAAMFAPECSFPSIAESEQFISSEVVLPGSFTYLSAYAKAISKYATWFAAAGYFRGVSPFKYSPVVAYGEAAIRTLQTRTEGDVSVDTIAEIRPFGNLVWGNRTLLPNVSWELVSDGGLKASHFLNIRHLCIELHKALYRASRKYTFEQNDDILWANYQAEIKPLLDRMKSGRGIRGYRIIKVASTKKAVLKAKIKINPIEAVEDFYIDIELTDNLDVSVEIE